MSKCPIEVKDIAIISFTKWKEEHKECYIKSFTSGSFKFTHCLDHNELYMRDINKKWKKEMHNVLSKR